MAYNLSRNSRLFVTTNVNTSTGAVLTTGMTPNNCWELNILDGFKFSQDTAQTNIQINEAGTAPLRGQQAFNTALNPVDISFSTYIRPKLSNNEVKPDEQILWNALFGAVGIDGNTYIDTGTLTTATTISVTGSGVTFGRASTLSGTVTLQGATITNAVAGTWYNIKNVTASGGSSWEGPAKLRDYTAGGSVVLEYATPPAANATTAVSAVGAKLDKAAWTSLPSHAGRSVACAQVSTAPSNRNQLIPLGFIFVVDNVSYAINNCAMDGATVDFGLDAIATVAWSAKGTSITKLASNITATGGGAMSGGVTGTGYTDKCPATSPYITNKLSTLTLKSKLYGTDGTAGITYSVILTGGSLQIQNNISYVTPSNLGIVNTPIGYYTGSRAITGTVNAYLRTGTTNDVGDLLATMATDIGTAAQPKYYLQLEMGGSTNPTRVEFEMPGAAISLPSVDVADVVTTSINFTAQATKNDFDSQTYDIENTNDLTVRYYAAA